MACRAMIRTSPDWTFESDCPLWQWYGHVWLLEKRVLGTWYCLDRGSGETVWHRKFRRPNTISGVTSEVIIATETRFNPDWVARRG